MVVQLVSRRLAVRPRRPVTEADRLRRLVREQAGIELATLVPADSGESGSTYLATGPSRVLKLTRNADALAALTEVVDKLRGRGYPAARIYASGRVDGMGFWLQEHLPGTVLDGQIPAISELLRLNDAQARLGDGTSDTPSPAPRPSRRGGADRLRGLTLPLFVWYESCVRI